MVHWPSDSRLARQEAAGSPSRAYPWSTTSAAAGATSDDLGEPGDPFYDSSSPGSPGDVGEGRG